MIETCERLLAWWLLGCVTAEQVVAWADVQILRADTGSELPNWLIDLSLKGPDGFFKLPQPDYPRPKDLTFLERFRVLVEVTNPDDEKAVHHFAKWVASAAMGEDLDLPEVLIGYEVEHAFSYRNSGDPYGIAMQAVRSNRMNCRDIAQTLGSISGGE
jgi:hypothetical protein